MSAATARRRAAAGGTASEATTRRPSRARARARTNARSWTLQAPDGWLLAIVLTLVVFGTVMIFSASFPQTADLAGSARFEPLIRQIMYMMIGLSGMFIAMQIDYHRYARWAFPAMLAIMLLLLALIVVPGLGTTTYGAKSWIYIGSISFQPGGAG